MSPEQEPKYFIHTDIQGKTSICNRATGVAIPDDEPIFIFRARDKYAAKALAVYSVFCCNQEHVDVVHKRIRDFERFAEDHPERMKDPDSPA